MPSSRPRVDKSDPAVPICFEALRQGVNLGEGGYGARGGGGTGTSQPLQSCEQQSVRKVSVPTMAADASPDKRQMGGQNGSLESPSGRQSVKRRMSHCSKNTDADLQIHRRDLKVNFSNNRAQSKTSEQKEMNTFYS